MTQSAIGAPAPEAPPPQTLDQHCQRLLREAEEETIRIAREQSPTPERLKQIISNTVLSLLKEMIGVAIYDHRTMLGIAGDLDRRMNDVEAMAFEGEGDSDGISEELATKVAKFIGQSLVFAQERLESKPGPDVRKAIDEHIALAAELTKEFTLEDEPDDPAEPPEPAEG